MFTSNIRIKKSEKSDLREFDCGMDEWMGWDDLSISETPRISMHNNLHGGKWCGKASIIKWPDLNQVEHFWNLQEWEINSMNVHLKNLQRLCEIIISPFTTISKECF